MLVNERRLKQRVVGKVGENTVYTDYAPSYPGANPQPLSYSTIYTPYALDIDNGPPVLPGSPRGKMTYFGLVGPSDRINQASAAAPATSQAVGLRPATAGNVGAAYPSSFGGAAVSALPPVLPSIYSTKPPILFHTPQSGFVGAGKPYPRPQSRGASPALPTPLPALEPPGRGASVPAITAPLPSFPSTVAPNSPVMVPKNGQTFNIFYSDGLDERDQEIRRKLEGRGRALELQQANAREMAEHQRKKEEEERQRKLREQKEEAKLQREREELARKEQEEIRREEIERQKPAGSGDVVVVKSKQPPAAASTKPTVTRSVTPVAAPSGQWRSWLSQPIVSVPPAAVPSSLEALAPGGEMKLDLPQLKPPLQIEFPPIDKVHYEKLLPENKYLQELAMQLKVKRGEGTMGATSSVFPTGQPLMFSNDVPWTAERPKPRTRSPFPSPNIFLGLPLKPGGAVGAGTYLTNPTMKLRSGSQPRTDSVAQPTRGLASLEKLNVPLGASPNLLTPGWLAGESAPPLASSVGATTEGIPSYGSLRGSLGNDARPVEVRDGKANGLSPLTEQSQFLHASGALPSYASPLVSLGAKSPASFGLPSPRGDPSDLSIEPSKFIGPRRV